MRTLHSGPLSFNRSDAKNVAQWFFVTAGGATVVWLADHSLPELREWSGIKACLVTVAVAVGRGIYRWVGDNRDIP